MTSEEVEKEAAQLLLYNAGYLEKEIKHIQKKAPLFALYYEHTLGPRLGAIMIITRQRDVIGLEGKCYFF